MKLQFSDTLKKEAIDLFFEIKGDEIEREIITEKVDIKWFLELTSSTWGIEGFHYELSELLMPIQIVTTHDIKKVEITLVYAEVKFHSKTKGYICRIYEDVMVDNKWKEDEYAEFPIELIVEESPAKEDGGRAQLFVKYLTLDLTSSEKKVILTI